MNIKKNLLYHKLLVLPILTLFVIFISLIEQPLTFYQQTLFSSIMCLAVLLINFRKGKFITLFLMGVINFPLRKLISRTARHIMEENNVC